MKVILITN